MECRACYSQLTALPDLELSPREATEVEQHLSSCPGCRSEYASLRFSRALMDQLPEADPSPHSWLTIRDDALPSPSDRRPVWWSLLPGKAWAPVGAATLVMVCSLSLLIPTRMEGLELARKLEDYVERREAEEALLETVWGLVDERDLPNPFSPKTAVLSNPFRTE